MFAAAIAKRVYIAGPMRGIKYYNHPAFDKAHAHLMAQGIECVNPAEVDRRSGMDPYKLAAAHDWSRLPHHWLTLSEVASHCLAGLQTCDGIYLLDGWQQSAGARAEKGLAEWLGKVVLYETRQSPMRIALCGPGLCGKDMAGAWLRENTPLRYVAGTSLFAAAKVYERLRGTKLGDSYASVEDCWRDRRNHRPLWAEIIGDINKDDPVALYRQCLETQDILTGLRWAHEQKAVREAGLCDLWVWIDRHDAPDDPTMQYGPDDCDIVIPNNGAAEEFYERLGRLAKAIGLLNGCQRPAPLEMAA